MPSLKKSKKSQIQNQKTNKLANLTISVFFLNILIISAVLILIFFIFGQNRDDKPSGWRALIEENLNHYPEMQPADIYKLIYQGTFGPAHLGSDSIQISNDLENELGNIAPDPSAPLFENITPSGKYVRLNLKRCKAAQIPTAKIVTSVLNSVSKSPDDSSRFIRRWEIVEKLVADGSLPISRADFFTFSDSIKKAGYPVIHHSKQYIENYQPSYRVIDRRYLNLINNTASQ
ncbi:MAG TPA: hypothetical protein P5268_03250 [Candidatus Marinimicrobia bacterium]|nr:hypothetical protein [Candidatus Neomarinimicrobiota bacterium]HRS52298.1 hypothetical protein [Candidatus Neomarinimicrobiota bacterium]HRU92036.1 hypothetical protein [Candidatus Neomarinimicrobiota bacterium]